MTLPRSRPPMVADERTQLVGWFEVLFLDYPAEANPQFGDVEDADFLVGDRPLAELLDEYEQQCAASNQIIAAHSLDNVARNQDFGPETSSLRWILQHMLEETGRHVGHLDIIRELLDGQRGYY